MRVASVRRARAARASNALLSEGDRSPEGTPGARRHPEIALIAFAA
jgi:hypothetical protein